MANIFNYQFNIAGNFAAEMEGMIDNTGKLTAKIKDCNSVIGKVVNTLAVWDMATNYVVKLDGAFQDLFSSGVYLDSQMHDLSAVAGVTGETLKEIEGYARKSAKAFGTDAAVAVEGYKLLLGQLSPELAKCPKALQAMGNSIQTTSKLMGNDGVAAAEVLTTAMNQYGVSLDDPIEASRKMAEMMNVMAAAGQEGSAELPAIKVALEQCGMAAKAANVSFEETNAAIQVLDKAGKKGSEGGVALRNTLAILSRGRFLPKQTREELAAAGIDVLALADTSLSLKERLDILKPVLNDAALFSNLFGMENANAARALVQNSDELGRLTTAITGTSSAEEQAAVVMDSYAERQARVKQKFEDIKISVFQATGDLSLWITTVTGALVPVSQLLPLLQGLWVGMRAIKNLQWATMWGNIKTKIKSATIGMLLHNESIKAGIIVSNGFKNNIFQAIFSLVRFATVGVFQALKGLGALLISFLTTGKTSVKFANIAKGAFGTFKTSAITACKAVGVAIKSIPVIGWVIAIIGALAAFGAYLWKTSEKFRGFCKGLVAAISPVGTLLKHIFTGEWGKIKEDLDNIKGAYNEAYNKEIAKSKEDEEEEKNDIPCPCGSGLPYKKCCGKPVELPNLSQNPENPTGGTLSGVGNSLADSGKIKNITVNIEKVVEKFEIHTTNLSGDMYRVKELVCEALLGAINDVNLAT